MKSRLLIILALTALLLASFTPAPSRTQAQVSSLAPTPTPASPIAVRCRGTLPSRLQVGGIGRVSLEPPIPHRVRIRPERGARVVGQLMPGEAFDVLEGPRCAGGWAWWRVRSQAQDLEGWTSEGNDNTYWVEPYSAAPLITPTPAPRPNAAGCVQPPYNLVSWWPADGHASDVAGANDGVLSSGAGFDSGIVGQAFRFNGKSYMSAPTQDLPTGNAERTLEFWVKVNRFQGGESFLVGYGKFGSFEQTYHVGTAGSTLFFSQWGQAIFGPKLDANRWYHVAVTNSGNATTLYLDGKAVASGSLPIDTPAGTQLYMGGLPSDPTKRLDGLVDEVSVYKRALTAAEIKSIFQAGQNGKCIPQQTGGPGLAASETPVVSAAGSSGPLAASFRLHLIGNAWSGVLLGQSSYPWGYLVDVTPLEPTNDGDHVETYIQNWFDGKRWVDTLFVGLPHPGSTLDVQVDVYTTQRWPVAFRKTLTFPASNSQEFFLGASSLEGAYVLDINPQKRLPAATVIVPAEIVPMFSDGGWWDLQRLAFYGMLEPLTARVAAYKAPGEPAATFEMHLEPGTWHGIGLGACSQEQAYVLEIDPLDPRQEGYGQEGYRLEKAVVQPEFDGKTWNDVLRVMIPEGQPAMDVTVKVYVIKK